MVPVRPVTDERASFGVLLAQFGDIAAATQQAPDAQQRELGAILDRASAVARTVADLEAGAYEVDQVRRTRSRWSIPITSLSQTQLLATRAFRYAVCGDLVRWAELGEPVYQAIQDLGTNWQEPVRFIADSCRMLLTGTLADHAEQIAVRLARPDHPSIPHLAAPAAALGFAQRGEAEQARQIAARCFTPPPGSWTRMHPMAYWAQVAAILGVPDPAWLYDHLAPHANEVAIAGVAGDCGGAADSLLAGLAFRLDHLDKAAEHAQAGLALEIRIGSQIWINRTTDLINRIGAARDHARSRD